MSQKEILPARDGDREAGRACPGDGDTGERDEPAGPSFEERLRAADAAIERGRLARAEQHLRAALGLEPPEAWLARDLALRLVEVLIGRAQVGPAREILETLGTAEPDRREARLLRLRGELALCCGRTEEAQDWLREALERSRDDDSGVEEARTRLAWGRLALDLLDGRLARAQAEAGLRALAPRPAGALARRLRLLAASAELETEGGARPGRSLQVAIEEARRSAEEPVQALGLVLEARVQAAGGRGAGATEIAERAIGLAEIGESPDALAQVLATALRGLAHGEAPDRLDAWRERLRSLHRDAERAARLELPALRQALSATLREDLLADDGLVALEDILGGTSPEAWLEDSLGLLARKIRFRRAAIVLDDPHLGLRVRASFQAGAEGEEGLPGGYQLALLAGERALLLGRKSLLVDLGSEGDLARHPEARAFRLGSLLVAPARSRLLVYLDRESRDPVFQDGEVRFVRAFVERLALEPGRLEPERQRDPEPGQEDDLGIVGASPAIVRLRQELADVAGFDIPVFLSGESGTGKELAARAIHRLSRRSGRPLVTLNCAAVPEGLLESELFGFQRGAFSGAFADREGLLAAADGGTLLLDEVGELSPAFQSRLLRVVELGEYRPLGASTTRHVNVRFVCATNRDMDREVKAGRFREDLYYRLLSTARVVLPPLRERPGDVPVLLAHFVRRQAERHGTAPLRFSPEAMRALEQHRYPGNVRELERLVAGLGARCARAGRVEVENLPFHAGRGPLGRQGTLGEALEAFERSWLRSLLEQHKGNRTRAARSAGISRQTLVGKIKRLELGAEKDGLPVRMGLVAEGGEQAACRL